MGHTDTRMGGQRATVLPAGTVTFLLTDVEGSTAGWVRSPEGLAVAIPRHYEVLDEAIGAHGGVRPVEQGEGDSTVAAFSRASDALAAAVDAQRSLTAEPWPDGAEVRVRMAVHTGEAQLRDEGNYVGLALARCARIRSCAHGGQVLVSEATAALVGDTPPPDVVLRDLGTHRLKDLGRPERVWQLVHPDLAQEFPPLHSLDAHRHNLPVQLTSFVGREAELAVIDKLLPETRILTLTGAGGCGKTRLALQLAVRVVDHYPDGVWVIELAPVNDGELVASTVLRALGLREEQGRPPAKTLESHLRDRRAMLILDNCEHLVPACAALADALVRSCPSVQVLATSRAPLTVEGEVPWRVPNLSAPTRTDPVGLDTMDGYEAVRLFIERARQARPNFEVTTETAPAVAEICRRLDGIPLAVELAAARARMLTPQEICDGLADRFRLLVGRTRTATRHHQTLQASVDWSYQLLEEDERVLLHRLSVFAGTVGLDTVEAVSEGNGLERLAILDVLAGLIDKSLVVVEDEGPAARYRLLETIRQYADARLAESGDRDRLHRRHRDHFVEAAERLGLQLVGTNQEGAAAALAEAYPNLAAAFEWSRGQGDTDALLRLVGALFYFFIIRGMFVQGRRWSQAALAPGDGSASLRVRALVADGHLAVFGGDVISTPPAVAEAVEIARDLDDEAASLRSEGLAAELTAFADPETGAPLLRDNLAVARDRGDVWWLTEGLCNLAVVHGLVGDFVQARTTSGEALGLAEAAGDRFERRQALSINAWAEVCRGDLPAALDGAVPLIAEARATHDTHTLIPALATLGLARTYQGDAASARPVADEAVRIAQESGGAWTTFALFGRAVLALHEGEETMLRWACESFDHAAAAFGYPPDLIVPWLGWGLVLSGDVETARRLLEPVHLEHHRFFESTRLAVQALIERVSGEPERAEDAAHRALALAQGNGHLICEVEAVETLAGVAIDLEGHELAARLVGAATARRRALHYARPPVTQPAHDGDVAAVIDALGADRYDAFAADGAHMAWDDTIDYVTRGRGERKRPASGWASLTPTELSVVKLVAEGLSNQQVAERLFIAPRTVGTHLTHVYAKLGLSTRTELAVAVLRRR
jgi:predicted ATPase/DNA-binding CsgD family transcriptional regulator